jgi:hypothetical protein
MDKTYVTEQFNIMGSVFDDMEIEKRAVHEAAAHCVWEYGLLPHDFLWHISATTYAPYNWHGYMS